MLFEPSQKGISDFLGAASITCWLFAQFPQVIENYRLDSCKGLALPFLVNWLLGDFTNLIGCIFTDQLPFQTYLATYFTFVDLILILQFWYYGRKQKHRLRHVHHHSHPSSRQGSQHIQHSGARSRPSGSWNRAPRDPNGPYSPSMTSSLIGNGVYDAHLIGSKDNGGLRHPVLPRGNSDSSPLVHFRESPQDSFPPAAVQTEENSYSNSEVQDGLPEMTDSILSQRSDASSSTIGALQRGRSIFRPPTSASAPDVRVLGQDETAGVSWRQMSGSRTRLPTSGSHSRPSQSRTRSVVFLSISAGLGLRGLYKRSATAMHSTGKDIAWKISTSHEINDFSLDLGTVRTSGEILPPPPIDYSLLVGRVAAWLCVCFYLTSRMPQIWKNFRRRSVEGLSILLFAAAFMGNLFYVLSILSSPLVQEDEGYLFESVPFLLGSGGTLIFDLTIMGQACLYAGLSPKTRERREHSHGEESSGLLARDSHHSLGDDLEHNQSRSDTGGLPRI